MKDAEINQLPWDFVPAKNIYEIFHGIVSPTGFLKVRNGVLARQENRDTYQLITLASYKGGQYGLHWGVSLSYMPHSWENELRWHRTLKSVRLDLWDSETDIPSELFVNRKHPGRSIPNKLHGGALFERSLRSEWEDLNSTILGWFSQAAGLAGVFSRSTEQCARQWSGPRHWPPPRLVRAFTLSRMGKYEEAVLQLKSELDENDQVRDPQGHLGLALERVAVSQT